MKRIALLALLGVAACGPGSKYDDLTGGSKEDQALDAPRPLSPLSVTMVSTSRPRLKWDLQGSATGAIVEMCSTRACDAIVKRYETTGRELVVPEDLEPGIWFWRLTGRTDKTHGTTTSPTWEVLVRGPAAHGSSDAPVRSLVDYDGDGHPDLFLVSDLQYDQNGTMAPFWIAFHAPDGGDLQADNDNGFVNVMPPAADDSVLPVTLAAGIDYDGDGFSDIAAGFASADWGTAFQVDYGGAKPFDMARASYVGGTLRTQPLLREAGDVDGDGYGDLFASDASNVQAHLGGPKGIAAMAPMIATADAAEFQHIALATRALAIGGGIDANADGFADFAFAFPKLARLPITQSTMAAAAAAADQDPHHLVGPGGGADDTTTPGNASFPMMIVAMGGNDRFAPLTTGKYSPLAVPNSGSDPVALSFVAGDFNGDGITDVAGTVQLGASRRVCVWFGDVERSIANGACFAGAAGDTILGESITAVDLEGDGVDELLAVSGSSGASVQVLRYGDNALHAAESIPDAGTALTTIWPGRPGKARWAVRSFDGKSVRVYEGLKAVQTISPQEKVRAFGRAMR